MKRGVYPASATPFDAKGQIDYAALARLIAWFKAGGCSGIVLAGTNGEGPSLSAVEKRDLVKTGVALADGLEVVLGIATSSLDEAIWLSKQAHLSGAHAVLVMPPSYFKEASADGIARWYEALFDKSPIGTLVYNLPQRTGVAISPETMKRLANHDRMIGLKDSSTQTENIGLYREALEGTGKGLFMGDETLLVSALGGGWTGTISGAANVIPGWLSQIVGDWDGNRESAETKFALIEPVLKAIRSCRQPGANKHILRRLGVLPSADVRLPLEPALEESVTTAYDLVRSLTDPSAMAAAR